MRTDGPFSSRFYQISDISRNSGLWISDVHMFLSTFWFTLRYVIIQTRVWNIMLLDKIYSNSTPQGNIKMHNLLKNNNQHCEKIYGGRGWKYHWNFENQHWVKNQCVKIPFGLKNYLELWKGLITRNVHEKYESPTLNGSKVMTKVKVFRYVGQRSRSRSLGH